MTTSRSDADIFAQVNPSMSPDTATIGINLRGGIDNAVRDGVISPVPELPGAYTADDWDALNRIATFELAG